MIMAQVAQDELAKPELFRQYGWIENGLYMGPGGHLCTVSIQIYPKDKTTQPGTVL
jgi:hypothetical protein